MAGEVLPRGFSSLEDLEMNLFAYVPDLKVVADKPAVCNPFKSNLKITMCDKIRIGFLCILLPIRMILLSVTFLFAGITAKICLLGYKETDPAMPFKGVRKFGQGVMMICARLCAFWCGFHHIKVKGSISPETRIIIAAPHSSFMDTFAIMLVGYHSPVTRTENLEHNFIGNCLRLMQPTAVSRHKKYSKIKGIKEIKRRANALEWHPTLLFPEGTCTNRKSYIFFKPGAFYPGLPVQPVILRYKDKMDYMTWTWIGKGAFPLLCLMMTRLYNTMELEILPLYHPSKEEINDSFLYARNVRDYVAKVDNIPVTDHSYEDCRLMEEARKLRMPMETGLVEYYKLKNVLGINCDRMIESLNKFSKLDQNFHGYLDIDEFCNYLNLPATEEIMTLFRIYNLHGGKAISFREFLIGQFLIAKHFSTDDNIKGTFDMFQPYQDGKRPYITEVDFLYFIRQKIDIYEDCVSEIYNEMDRTSSGRVYFEDFKEFCTEKPEYVLIFMHFRHKDNIIPRECDDDPDDEETEYIPIEYEYESAYLTKRIGAAGNYV